MEDITDRKDLWCRMFRRTLEGDAINWYVNLPCNSINNFDDLQSKFLETFNHLIKRKTDHSALLNVRQKIGETLGEYVKRFSETLNRVEKSTDSKGTYLKKV